MFRPLTLAQRVVDVLIAAGYLTLVVAADVTGGIAFERIPVAVVIGVALALRRWSPALALAASWVAAAVQIALGLGPDVIDAAIPPVVYASAAYGARPVRWAGFTSSLVGGGIAGVVTAGTAFAAAMASTGDLGPAIQQFGGVALLTAAVLLLAWTLGLLVATARQSHRNRQRAVQAGRETAAEQERTRIARDMHDVVAHSLAVVIAQSDGARLVRRTDPEAVEEALETIGSTARAALADVRVLLQQLRYEGTTGVQPGLRELPELIDRFRASGLDVGLELRGEVQRLGTSAQLAAFRIVQESLTNALRHGDRDRPARVALTQEGPGVSVEVVSGLDPARPMRAVPEGHGLIGMRERASIVQGDLTAEPDGDVFRVRAFLPSTATAAVPLPIPAGAGTRDAGRR